MRTTNNLVDIYCSKNSSKFVVKIIGLMNELMHQTIYKLWKIKQMMNVRFTTDVNQLVDSFHAVWKEDNSLYMNQTDSSNSQNKSRSQQMVNFFLGKLK
mmetsp:Transcript_29194/g.33420  ORF Transcript_29194/g.33420 Transcript_29194/m.33420 type:complete len:99 (-) Transcript_29194:1358-1654(-)